MAATVRRMEIGGRPVNGGSAVEGTDGGLLVWLPSSVVAADDEDDDDEDDEEDEDEDDDDECSALLLALALALPLPPPTGTTAS